MLSLLEVKCPHCQMRGQISVPPMGALVFGPCPQCGELLLVFCGRVLQMDKDIMMNGSDDEKHGHLMDVLTEFLDGRVRQMLDNSPDLSEEIRKQVGGIADAGLPSAFQPETCADIGQHEVDQFVNVDLKLLDNNDYFRSIFGPRDGQ